MPRIPRRRKQIWEEPPAAEQADPAATPQADATDQPTTQLSTGDPLGAASAPAAEAPAAAGDGTVQTDPLAAAEDRAREASAGEGAAGAAGTESAVGYGGAAGGAGAESTAGAAGAESAAGYADAESAAGGASAADTTQPTEAMAAIPGPVQQIEPTEPPTVVQPAAPIVAEGATGAAVVGDVAPPAAGSSPTPEAEAEAEAALHAEQAPEDARPGFRERTRMRRRLRYLRRLRELAFRDLGGLVFDLHRFDRTRNDLVLGKLQALAGIDHELRTLEAALRERTDFTDVREAGIAACPRCGTLHDTDANFCPGCGTSLRSAIVRDASPVTVIPAEQEQGALPATSGTPAATTTDPNGTPHP